MTESSGEKTVNNPLALKGIEFVEFAAPNSKMLEKLFFEFGFSKTMALRNRPADLFTQNDIRFIVNRDDKSFGGGFSRLHGPSICSMGWRVADARQAMKAAVERGARAAERSDFLGWDGKPLPAIYGIGDSLIYFVEKHDASDLYVRMGFDPLARPERVPSKGFLTIDHLTNNVEKGTMKRWADFYKTVFGFTEVRYFDIRGVRTGLTSYALKSPCGTFCIPINEADEEKSQINEYLREYKGPGIQHLAFSTNDILAAVDSLNGTSISTLDIDDEYYDEAFKRVPNVTESRAEVQKRKVLIDGDEQGYLLQIFTKNIIGPIFIEIIQRKNHHAFGEGNFTALFRSIERDQAKRGVFGDSTG